MPCGQALESVRGNRVAGPQNPGVPKVYVRHQTTHVPWWYASQLREGSSLPKLVEEAPLCSVDHVSQFRVFIGGALWIHEDLRAKQGRPRSKSLGTDSKSCHGVGKGRTRSANICRELTRMLAWHLTRALTEKTSKSRCQNQDNKGQRFCSQTNI